MAVFYLKKRPSKRADGLRRNNVENEALFRRFIGVSGSLRRRFRWPELFFRAIVILNTRNAVQWHWYYTRSVCCIEIITPSLLTLLI